MLVQGTLENNSRFRGCGNHLMAAELEMRKRLHAANTLNPTKYHYSTFAFSWSSSTHSGSGISGMFHPHETGCNGHVSVQENRDIERLTSRAYTFVSKCREQTQFSARFSVLLSNTFQWGKWVRNKGKSHLLRLRLRREEIENWWDSYLSF